LAIAIMELAYGDVVSGGSRLVTGLAQLPFLALGMLVATSLVGLPPERLLPEPSRPALPWLEPWFGVALVAVGLARPFSMPLRQLPWLLLVPGSLGMIGLTEFVANDKLAGIDNFVTTVLAVTAIALGSMLGAGLVNALGKR